MTATEVNEVTGTDAAASVGGVKETASRAKPLVVVYRGGDNVEDPRKEIPVLGFRDYWYPVVPVSKISRRGPMLVTLLGTDLCVFFGKRGPAAISDVCPHRGVRMSDGDCHYAGTVSCPYHGWTFDEDGTCVAVLSEGPNSTIAGRAHIRTYPTAVIKGVLFAWMGDGKPTRPEDDLPPELSDDSVIFTNRMQWKTNWRQAIENMNDNHVWYVHRNSVQGLMIPIPKTSYRGARGIISGSGVTLSRYTDDTIRGRPYREYFPGLGLWPKHRYRLLWTWMFKTRLLAWIPNLSSSRSLEGLYEESAETPPYHKGTPEFEREWNTGPNMPGIFRISFGDVMFTRWCVPVDEHTTRLFYLYAARPSTRRQALWLRFVKYPITFKLLHDRNLGIQDGRILEREAFDTPETFSSYDIETMTWRKLAILSSRYGGRHDLIPKEVIDRVNRIPTESAKEGGAELLSRP